MSGPHPPAALGRGVVVAADSEPPGPWAGAPSVTITADALRDPAEVVERLHAAWLQREPVVVVLQVDAAEFRAPLAYARRPFELTPAFEAWHDRLHFLVWANNYDGRDTSAPPVWWWARKASRLGAEECARGEPADVRLPDATLAWVDGGPRSPQAAARATAGSAIRVIHAESIEGGSLNLVPPVVEPAADLAADQRAAVAHERGPARVIAPAGSGKTRVLTERLRHLIVDRGYETNSVTAVAYNKRAQLELESRCADFRPRVQTLNALGLSVLSAFNQRAPTVVDEREVRRIIEGLVPTGRRRANTDPIGPYIEALSTIRLGLVDPETVEDARDDVPGVASAFEPYRDQLARQGAVDFDEQIYGAIEALLHDGEFRRRMQQRHRHLLVDEFQDLTPAHVLLIRLLSTPQLDVCGVGDDDQVIYGHAGADPGYLLDFAAYFPGADHHALEVNYRCPAKVTEAAATLLSYNERRVDKVIRPATPGPTATGPEALQVIEHSPDSGATQLAELVEKWMADGAAPADIAVLARVNSLLLAPHIALAAAGAPINSVLSPRVLDRTGVRAALAYLRIAADPADIDGRDLIEVYRRPSRGFPNWITKWFKGRFTLDRVEAMADAIDDAKVAQKMTAFAGDLRAVTLAAGGGSTRDVLRAVKDDVGLGGAMSMLDTSTGGEGSSHLDDLEALEQVADLHPELAGFEPWLRRSFQREADDQGVTLSTIHRVKGQEWPRVALFGASAGLIPHRLADDIEEERRVFHVAITRSISQVAVLADASRPSPFIDELDGSADRQRDLRPTRPKASPSAAGTATAAASPADPRAVDALKAWRLERARADAVPAYVVLSDKYLEAIAARRPQTLDGLLMCPGIGPSKLDKYGDEILEVLGALED